MPLIDTLFATFKDAEELLHADALNSEALARHGETLEKLIKSNDEKIKNSQTLLAKKEEELSPEEITERNAIGKYSAEHRKLTALFPIFAYMALRQETAQSLYAWLLDWQLSLWSEKLTRQPRHVLSVELNDLIKRFIEFNKHAAIAYYHAHQEELDRASPPATRRMQDLFSEEETLNKALAETAEEKSNEALTKKDALNHWQDYFNDVLKGQCDEPQSIAPLALHYYNEPYAFAAILIWMLEHGVPPLRILHSGLLHHFFAGHAAYIESLTEENPVKITYEILAQSKNPAVVSLCQLAKQHCAYVSGKQREEMLRSFNGYDLTGQQHTKETRASGNASGDSVTLTVLSRGQIRPIKATINNTLENIQALSKAFPSTFLRLLANNPKVASAFTPEQWQDYFAMAIEAIGDDLTSFPDLLDLHALLVKHHSPLATTVIVRIIDTALLHREHVEWDDFLLRKIKSLLDEPTRAIILEQAKAFVKSLYDCIEANTREWSQSNYHAIEDMWQEKHLLIGFLKKLYYRPLYDHPQVTFPAYFENIYALQTYVLQTYTFNHDDPNLEEALRFMCTAYATEAEASAHEKRLLESCLSVAFNYKSFYFIRCRLFEKHNTPLQFFSSLKINLFAQCCELGNLPLVTRMLTNENDKPTKQDVIKGLMRAAENRQPLIVKLILGLSGDNTPSQLTIGEAFEYALTYKRPSSPDQANKRLELLIFLLDLLESQNASEDLLKHLLHLAVHHHQLEFISAACRLNDPRGINDKRVASLFVYTAQNNNFLLLSQLIKRIPDKSRAPIQQAIMRALCLAADHNELDFINAVCDLGDDALPYRQKMMAALNYAFIQNNHELSAHLFVQMISQIETITVASTLEYINLRLEDKTIPEKYSGMVDLFKSIINIASIETLITLFNIIDGHNAVLSIDTTPRSEPHASSFFTKNGGNTCAKEWTMAWGEIRQLIFDKWQAELAHPETLIDRQKHLVDLFKGCGKAGSNCHKLMGMRRTSGKADAKTSELIEREISRVRSKPLFKLYTTGLFQVPQIELPQSAIDALNRPRFNL